MQQTHEMYDVVHPIETRFLVQLDIQGNTPNELGVTYRGRRRVVFLAGGTFRGPRLNGRIHPGGGDSALVRPDGVFEIDVRALMDCDDGAQIYLTYNGFWHAEPQVMDRLLRREGGLDLSEFYCRATFRFETSDPRYLWLNSVVTVGRGMPRMGTTSAMTYQVHEVL